MRKTNTPTRVPRNLTDRMRTGQQPDRAAFLLLADACRLHRMKASESGSTESMSNRSKGVAEGDHTLGGDHTCRSANEPQPHAQIGQGNG